MSLLDKVKRILGIEQLEKENKALQAQLKLHRNFVNSKMAELKEFTRVDADVGIRGNNTIILTGVIRNWGYVRFYDLGDGEFERLVYMLRDMQKTALIRNVDKPPAISGSFFL